MTNALVLEALVEVLIFLEFSEDEVVDPDAAIEVMETIAGILQRMSSVEREAFLRQLEVLSDTQAISEIGQRRSEYISDMPGYLGLA